MSNLNIKGWHKTSLLDYPDKVATTIFTGGCNFKCPFCHNGDLVLEANKIKGHKDIEILEHLKKREKILDGICITGGEPTLNEGIYDFIKEVKQLDILIKLDTNGYKPDVLKNLLNKKLLDYVAMDIKNSKKKYSLTTGVDIDISKIEESIEILINSNIDYEFRTTVIREFHTEQDFEDIGEWIIGAKKYYIQQYSESEKQIKKGYTAYEPTQLEKFKEIMKKYVNEVGIRGL